MSKLLAMTLGLPISATYALNEMTAALMAHSVLHPGFSTLLLNMAADNEILINASEK